MLLKLNTTVLFGCGLTTIVSAATIQKTYSATPSQVKSPNVIVLLADDMGYADIEPFGSTRTKTPNLQRLADEGVKLSCFYAAPTSTPSRVSLMTGCYQRRAGLYNVLFPKEPRGLHPDEVTIADVFSQAGYTTGCIGKWHMGDQQGALPLDNGFDTFLGVPYSNSLWMEEREIAKNNGNMTPLPILRDKVVVETVDTEDDQANLTRLWTEEGLRFIEKSREQPFFLYLAYTAVHGPRFARAEYVKASMEASPTLEGEKMMVRAQVLELDWSVGLIMEKLKELGLDDNTIVIFTSDNGGTKSSDNSPFRGFKGETYEGGLREPTIFWAPNMLPAGKEWSGISGTIDIMPTFAKMLDVALPTDRKIDGKDIWSMISSKKNLPSPHDVYYLYAAGRLDGVRKGDWKLHYTKKRKGVPSLYNLKDDISESRDVAQLYPKIVAELKSYYNYMQNEDIGVESNCREPIRFENPTYLTLDPKNREILLPN